jgi:uncharacterized protein
VSTPLNPLPPNTYSGLEVEQRLNSRINPDNPPWGMGSAVLVWLASVVAISLVPLIVVLAFSFYRNPTSPFEILQNLSADPIGIFVSVAAIVPAHLLTLGIVWAVVTDFGNRSFRATLGWSWAPRFGFWNSAGLALVLLCIGMVLTRLFGGTETSLDKIIASSPAARYTLAFLAVATAPLIEELVYRGVLYPALQRQMGRVLAILSVSALFASVHVFQYIDNIGVIVAVSMLSLVLTYVRSVTGKLLPCFIIHLIFNGIQATVIAFEPFIRRLIEKSQHLV